MTCEPAWNFLAYGFSLRKDDAAYPMAYPYKKPTSPTLELSDFTELGVLGDELQLSDVVLYQGGYDWLGRVVAITQNYVVLMDWEGKLCRVVSSYGEWKLLARKEVSGWWSVCPEATAVVSVTTALLDFKAVRKAIRLSLAAEYDPADFDQWNLPLVEVVNGDDMPLTKKAETYYRWPAVTRRIFETTIDMMRGHRQREVFIRSILGGISSMDITDEYGLKKSAVRTARWRAKAFMQASLPNYVF